MLIHDNQGRPHVFPLGNKTTLRLPPHGSITVDDAWVSDEIKREIELGWISILPETADAEIARQIKKGGK